MVLNGVGAVDPATRLDAARRTATAIDADLIGPSSATMLPAWLGDVDGAVAAARRSHMGHPSVLPYLFLPPSAPLRRDRRFMQLAQQLGLVTRWRETGRWPDFCHDPALPYNCRAEAAKLVG